MEGNNSRSTVYFLYFFFKDMTFFQFVIFEGIVVGYFRCPPSSGSSSHSKNRSSCSF